MKPNQIFLAYTAGVLTATALAYLYWRSQLPPPAQ